MGRMKASGPYVRIERAIRANGFFTSIQPLEPNGGVKLVCASDGGDWGIGGVSFWITHRANRWFIGTWTPHIYELSVETDVVQVMIAALGAATQDPLRNYYTVDPSVVAACGLREIEWDEFDALEDVK